MISLCSKGPSFVPVPREFDWLQLQKDFDKFANRIRTKLFFSDNTDNNIIPNEELMCAPRKPSKWKAPKSSIPEVETYLSSTERDLFCESKAKKVKDNLSNDERLALNTWRKNYLFNSEGKLIMHLQGKGNRFIIVDKHTDKRKALDQIEKSSFTKLDFDPTQTHIQKVISWAEKWHTI